MKIPEKKSIVYQICQVYTLHSCFALGGFVNRVDLTQILA